ncbi:hypothetical protein KPH14_009760 [Odynerus spinipes]|uniref:SCAN box domain-containing protein n=1 Tax=Odynerus spinipes TaxID=1348599 RepID=A0AAD9REY8_9HYME|nr:hypothetical protein KPH14_009760 [Odynerus spinipes]
MDLFHLFQEIRTCKGNTAIYRKLITLNPLFKSTLNTENVEEWQLILSHIMEILTSNQDAGKEWILLASHAFFLLQSARCDSESLQSCFIHFLEVHPSELSFINNTYRISNSELFNCIENLSWQNETKYVILAEICNMSECNIAVITSRNFLFNLSTSLTKSHLRCLGKKVYMNILKKLSEEDWIKSFGSIIKCLIYQWEMGPKKDYNALKSLCKYWLEPTILKYKNILLYLWEICKDLVVPFFHSNLQRIASEMYIIFPQNIDLSFYVHHKDEVIRLNGFAICCYYCSKMFSNEKIDYFIILKQFLWYNANTTSIFLREGIIKYFTIFYTNILKSSENFGYNQYIYDIVHWLHEFLLDCFEPGSCYQRKILGLNLYKVVLFVMNTYTCKHPIAKEHVSTIMPYDKCMKIDIKKKFTNKKCLLVLLKLIQDNILDIKQTSTYIIINYFEKDVLRNTEKKVLFDIAIENCNSFKFYEAESGAEFMRVLATWEPFNTKFITNTCETNALCNSYHEFFFHEAQKQLLQMKQDILKAIIHNAPFYGILIAMLNTNFRHSLEYCKPPLYFIEKLLDFLDDAVNFFLSILSSKSENTECASSFAEMGLAINDTIKTSTIQDDNYDDLILSPAHQVIVSCIWLSLKVICEIASNIGSSMYSNETSLHSIKLITMVLTKCRHKGAIESAGVAIGNLARCICKEDNNDTVLKMHINNLLQDNTMNGLNMTRRGAGFSLMFHKIVANDNRKARHLHFLRTLVADKELHVQLMSYMERITLVCFQYIQSEIWPIRNASLQLFGAVVPRLVGQSAGGKELDFGNGYSINHFITHYPTLTKHISIQLQYFTQSSENSNSTLHEYSNIVHILILLSKFSISGCDFVDYLSYSFVTKMKSYFSKLLANPIGYVRILTAKAYAALTAYPCIKSEMKMLQLNISSIKNVNTIHGYLLTMKYLREKFLTEVKSISPYKVMKSATIVHEGQCINEYRIQKIRKIWDNKLKTKSNQQICYIIECMLLELLDLNVFSSNIELLDKIILESSFILHIEKIKPGFYQFINILIYLYADCIKHTDTINKNIIDKILHSECMEQTIQFLTHLHHFIPLLTIIINSLLVIIDNGNVLVINTMITFVIATLKSLSLIDIYELKLEEIIMNLIVKFDRTNSRVNVLHLKRVLIAICCKDEEIIYKTLSTIFSMSLNENEYIKNEAAECLQFLIQRFPKVEPRNKLGIIHCCLILLKDTTVDMRNSIIINIKNHIMSIVYEAEDISKHDEFIYQQLLIEMMCYTPLSNFLYLKDNLEFIKQFVGLDKSYNKESTLIENPFDYDDNTLYKEETKFLNILYVYIQSNEKCRRLKYEGNVENYIDPTCIIQSKDQLLEKIDINFNCLRELLLLNDKKYLFKKQEVLIYEYNGKK